MFLRHQVKIKMLLGGAWYVPQLERVREVPLLGVAWAFGCDICFTGTITNPEVYKITVMQIVVGFILKGVNEQFHALKDEDLVNKGLVWYNDL